MGTNLFAGTAGSGVFRSTNNGASWTQVITGLTYTTVSSLEVMGTNVFAGTLYGGIYLSTDSGTSWIQTGLADTSVLSLAVMGTNILAGTYGHGVFISTDNGANWLQTSMSNPTVYALAVSGTNLFAGTNYSVYLSINTGTSWTAIGSDLPNYSVYSFGVSPNETNSGNLYTGTNYGFVYLSYNNGMNWNQVASNLYDNDAPVSSLAVMGTNLFAGTAGSGVFLLANNGSSWTAIDSGLTNKNINALAVNGTNLFAGTDGGVYLSTNNGTSWTQANTNLTDTSILSLAIMGTNLIAGTRGSGVWMRPLSEMITAIESVKDQVPIQFKLDQNYPNPFNPSTTIIYSIPKAAQVILKVYNVLGKEVATLVNEEELAGNYSVVFNARNLSSGIYFYRMQAESFVGTKKLILIK